MFHVQIADAPTLSMDHLIVESSFPLHARSGRSPMVEYVAALKEIGYEGVLSLEIFNDRFRAGSAPDVAIDGMRSLTYLFEQVHANRSRTPDPSIRSHNVEFIEFCASEEEALSSGRCCAPWGSRRPIDIVEKRLHAGARATSISIINCEPEGFAHSFDTGPRRIGLRHRLSRR